MVGSADDLSVGPPRGSISVAGGLASRAATESVAPSSRQNFSVSSSYLRLHLGQRFIKTSADFTDYRQGKEHFIRAVCSTLGRFHSQVNHLESTRSRSISSCDFV